MTQTVRNFIQQLHVEIIYCTPLNEEHVSYGINTLFPLEQVTVIFDLTLSLTNYGE